MTSEVKSYERIEVGRNFGQRMESDWERRLAKRAGHYGLGIRKVVTPDIYLLLDSCTCCIKQLSGLDAVEDYFNVMEDGLIENTMPQPAAV